MEESSGRSAPPILSTLMRQAMDMDYFYSRYPIPFFRSSVSLCIFPVSPQEKTRHADAIRDENIQGKMKIRVEKIIDPIYRTEKKASGNHADQRVGRFAQQKGRNPQSPIKGRKF